MKFIPAQYGEDIPDVVGKDVLIVDFSFNQPEMQRLAGQARRVIVLDHHKTAEAELSGFTRMECVGGPFEKRYADRMIEGVGVCFDMNKSGCRLAWEYCFGDEPMPEWFAAVEDRDLWRFALPATKEICISIRSHPREFQIWDGFDAGEMATEGVAIRRYVDMIVSNICDTAFVENIGGHDVPVAACSYDFVSETANQLLHRNPDAPFAACIIRSYDGVTYSLRSMNDRMDVSEIAKANGGGGHRNAAGFRAKSPSPSAEIERLRTIIRDQKASLLDYSARNIRLNDQHDELQAEIEALRVENERVAKALKALDDAVTASLRVNDEPHRVVFRDGFVLEGRPAEEWHNFMMLIRKVARTALQQQGAGK